MATYRGSEINSLKDNASRFLHKYREYFKKDFEQFNQLENIDQVKEAFDNVIETTDSDIETLRVIKCLKNSVTCLYSVDAQGNVELYNLRSEALNVTYVLNEKEVVAFSKGKQGKVIQDLKRLQKYGYLYSQPQNDFPSVMLNAQGGFRSFN